jgi:Zn-finger domain-containing protein
MLGKGFSNNCFDVRHIISKTELESQKELEERLLEMHHQDRFQLTLFGGEQSDSELIADAYKKQNLAIGYNRNTNIEQGDEE